MKEKKRKQNNVSRKKKIKMNKGIEERGRNKTAKRIEKRETEEVKKGESEKQIGGEGIRERWKLRKS